MTIFEKVLGGLLAAALGLCAWLAHDGQVTKLKDDKALLSASSSMSSFSSDSAALSQQLDQARAAASVESAIVTQTQSIRKLSHDLAAEAQADPGLQAPVSDALRSGLAADYRRLCGQAPAGVCSEAGSAADSAVVASSVPGH